MPALRPNLPLLATVLGWGFNFVALKLLYMPGQMDPGSVGLTRFAIMWLVLAAYCLIRGISLRYPRGDELRIVALGFLSMGAYMVLFLEGMKGSSAAEGAIILATSPIFTAIIASLAGQERLNLGSLGGAAMALGGVVLVIMGGVREAGAEPHRLAGNLLVLASAVVWAGSTVLSRPLVASYPPVRVLTLAMPGALCVLLPYGIAATIEVPWPNLHSVTWWMLLYMALVAGVMGFAGFYVGVRQVGAAGAMVYQYLVPPTAAISAWLVLGQAMHPLQFGGLIVVLAGVAISMHSRRSPESVAVAL